MCLYSKLTKNRKYTPNKKNGGQVPAVSDPRTLYVPMKCGNCVECRKQKARDWQIRLTEDIKANKNGKFIALTFSDESIKQLEHIINYETIKAPFAPLQGYELDNEIATVAVRRFLERWRKQHKKSIRHWLITELGHNGTQNIHLHGIIWTNHTLQEVEKTWQYGFIWKGEIRNGQIHNYVNDATINYMTKYVTKIDADHKLYKPIILNTPGIGQNYTKKINGNHEKNKFAAEKTDETYRTPSGHKISLPIYYRNKIYTDEQREQLWIQKLNQETRYVCGEKIDVSKDLTQYWNTIDYYRTQSAKLGYGNDQHNTDRAEYEVQLRIIMIQTRIEKAKKQEEQKKYKEHKELRPVRIYKEKK